MSSKILPVRLDLVFLAVAIIVAGCINEGANNETVLTSTTNNVVLTTTSTTSSTAITTTTTVYDYKVLEKTCDAISDASERQLCIWELALRSGNKSLCNLIDGELKDDCLIKHAVSGVEDGLCYSVGDPKKMRECIEKVALVEDNIRRCYDLENEAEKSSCLVELATTTKDSSFCTDIKDEAIERICLRQAALKKFKKSVMPPKTLKDCLKLSPLAKDGCLRDIAAVSCNKTLCETISRLTDYDRLSCIAVTRGDETVCDLIGEPEKSVKCAALAEYNASLCDRLKSHNERRDCIRDIAEITGDVDLCEHLVEKGVQANAVRDCVEAAVEGKRCKATYTVSDIDCYTEAEDVDRDWCLRYRALSFGDPSICNDIRELWVRDECINHFALKDQVPGLCEKIVESDKRQICFLKLSRQLDDITLCQMFKGAPHTVPCYSYFTSRNDSSICLKLTDDERRGYCLKVVAQNTKDIEPCHLINSSGWKAGCYKLFVDDVRQKEVCESIPRGSPEDGGSTTLPVRDTCFLNLAFNRKDPMICDRIESLTDRRYCRVKIRNFFDGN